MILALIAGCCFSVSGIHAPDVMSRTVGMFAVASGALSLFVIGGTLVGLPAKGLGRRVLPITFGKLIFHPAAIILAILATRLFGMEVIDPSLCTAAVIMAAVPMLSIYTILAQVYGQEDFTAPAMLVTTVTSFFTLSGLLWLLKHVTIW